jgi:hypothetical protein
MPVALTVGLEATPSVGFSFTAWTGDCVSTTQTVALVLGGTRVCGPTWTPLGDPNLCRSSTVSRRDEVIRAVHSYRSSAWPSRVVS